MKYEDGKSEMIELIDEIPTGYPGNTGYIGVLVGKCDVCHTPNVPVIVMDSSGGEYGVDAICKDCIDKAFNTLKTPVVFWQAEINKYEKYDDSLNYETAALEYFQDEANAKAWLVAQQVEIAPLDQWVDGKYEDDYSGIYMPFIYQLRTKD